MYTSNCQYCGTSVQRSNKVSFVTCFGCGKDKTVIKLKFRNTLRSKIKRQIQRESIEEWFRKSQDALHEKDTA